MKCHIKNEAGILAEEHWMFLEKWLHLIFTDAFKHGYKHAIEDAAIMEGDKK